MKRILSGISAALLSVAIAAPAFAAPVGVPAVPQAGNMVIDVQTRDDRFQWQRIDRDRRYDRGDRRGDYRSDRRNYDRRDARYDDRGPVYRGHRGYRDYRPGYRRHDGFWYPAAAFIAGAIITGAISQGRPAGSAHVNWCSDRYRSYRASDDTFQPYNGPRQRCNSPYN
jgi:hypothetical protein